MLIDHPPRPLISPLSSHLSYPSDTSFSFAFLPASSLAFYRVGTRWEIAAEDRLLSTFLPSFFISLQDFQFLPATPSNASILRSWILGSGLNYARLFFFFFFEKNLRDCKKSIVSRDLEGVPSSPDRGTSDHRQPSLSQTVTLDVRH